MVAITAKTAMIAILLILPQLQQAVAIPVVTGDVAQGDVGLYRRTRSSKSPKISTPKKVSIGRPVRQGPLRTSSSTAPAPKIKTKKISKTKPAKALPVEPAPLQDAPAVPKASKGKGILSSIGKSVGDHVQSSGAVDTILSGAASSVSNKVGGAIDKIGTGSSSSSSSTGVDPSLAGSDPSAGVTDPSAPAGTNGTDPTQGTGTNTTDPTQGTDPSTDPTQSGAAAPGTDTTQVSAQDGNSTQGTLDPNAVSGSTPPPSAPPKKTSIFDKIKAAETKAKSNIKVAGTKAPLKSIIKVASV